MKRSFISVLIILLILFSAAVFGQSAQAIAATSTAINADSKAG